jgi:hypothetical protein
MSFREKMLAAAELAAEMQAVHSRKLAGASSAIASVSRVKPKVNPSKQE